MRERDETVNNLVSECSKLAQKECKNKHDSAGKGDPLGIVQAIKCSLHWQIIHAQHRSCFRMQDSNIMSKSVIEMNHTIPAKRQNRPSCNKQEEMNVSACELCLSNSEIKWKTWEIPGRWNI